MKRGRGKTLVLEYHRVAEKARDPQSLRVTPHHFSAQIEALARRCEIVPLGDVVHPSSQDRAAITFDDGYVDNLTNAAPILQRNRAPFTVFVVAGFVDTDRAFWWDRLELLVLDRPDVPSIAVEKPFRLWADTRLAEGRERAYDCLQRRLFPLPPEQIEMVLEELSSREDVPAVRAVLSTDELQELAEVPGASIGSHTMDHPMLASLDARDQESQVSESRRVLEQATGRKVDAFAYPYGIPGSYTSRTIKALRRAGYSIACANFEGSPSASDPFELPRYIVRDWDEAGFVGRLDEWFAAA